VRRRFPTTASRRYRRENARLLLRLLDSNGPEGLQSRGLTEDSRADEPTRTDVRARERGAFGPNEPAVDKVEEALAFSLVEAARAGNWGGQSDRATARGAVRPDFDAIDSALVRHALAWLTSESY
jgi:hypothetical protein